MCEIFVNDIREIFISSFLSICQLKLTPILLLLYICVETALIALLVLCLKCAEKYDDNLQVTDQNLADSLLPAILLADLVYESPIVKSGHFNFNFIVLILI